MTVVRLAQVWPLLVGPTVEQTVVEVLDSDDNLLGELAGNIGWKVTQNVNAPIRGGGSISFEAIGDDIDWFKTRFRLVKIVNGVRWNTITGLPQSPTRLYGKAKKSIEVNILDKTHILARNRVLQSYVLMPGDNVVEKVIELIQDTGETSISIPASDMTARTMQVWGIDATRLRIINDMLSSIDYFAIWADGNGTFRSEPYKRPQDRPVAAAFIAGERAIHSSVWKREQDIANVPNVFIAESPGDADEPGLFAIAINDDPNSPYSTVHRGVVADEPEQVQAATQEVLEALAQRRLRDRSTPVSNLSVTHAPVPLRVNECVIFHPSQADRYLAVIQNLEMSSDPYSQVSGTWRIVPND